jgi:hypothetical protein
LLDFLPFGAIIKKTNYNNMENVSSKSQGHNVSPAQVLREINATYVPRTPEERGVYHQSRQETTSAQPENNAHGNEHRKT